MASPDVSRRSIADIALWVVDRSPAMIAYWDQEQLCRFANQAYRDWFGRSREQLVGTHIKDLLGPALYEKNLPHILGALNGQTQVFERDVPRPDGGVRESIATYTPDMVNGVVHGFFVQVADVTPLKQKERELQQAISERDTALAEVRTLRGLLSVCAWCKQIRNEAGQWVQFEAYVRDHTYADFSHGMCPACAARVRENG
jgi:PAS domain S-box-containing protein